YPLPALRPPPSLRALTPTSLATGANNHKKSCDLCVARKVKCSGATPCR
ncbi:unnamed protein product, partial [Ectocarpus sp. 13 AM-2016]